MSISGTKHVPKLVPTERAELIEPIPNVFSVSYGWGTAEIVSQGTVKTVGYR